MGISATKFTHCTYTHGVTVNITDARVNNLSTVPIIIEWEVQETSGDIWFLFLFTNSNIKIY
jgi:hypothetical protein